jgi:hypothetical protein
VEIAIVKSKREDWIAITRADGSRIETVFPHKGPVPHDAVHLFVERALGLGQAFWGMVAGGRHPEEIAGMAKASGHASAKRAAIPDASIVELLQAERLVECFEADLWNGGDGDPETFIAVAKTACLASHVPPPPLSADMIGRIRTELRTFARDWQAAGPGHTVRLEWD